MAKSSRDELMPRRLGGMGRGAALALLVHAGLIVAIAFSVNWRRSADAGVEAELWAAVPQVAAPPLVAPPQPAPKPEPKVEAPPPPPPPKVEPKPEPQPDPQIAIEKARKEKEEKERLERERLDKLEKEKQAKAEREKQERERLEKEKREAAAKAEREKREKAAEEKRLAEAREQQMQRVLGMAGATGTAPAGTAAQSAGPSASYAGRVIARLKPLSVFSDAVAGNPRVEVELKLGPDGAILSKRMVKRSGVPAWDEAVLRAIEKAEVMPRDNDGRVPPSILISWGPND
jgi:colicin import membrane protein